MKAKISILLMDYCDMQKKNKKKTLAENVAATAKWVMLLSEILLLLPMVPVLFLLLLLLGPWFVFEEGMRLDFFPLV